MEESGKKPVATLLGQEQSLTKKFISLFVVLSVTGFVTYLVSFGLIFNQWVYLAHTLIGVLFIPVFVFYALVHFKRTMGQRRPLLLIGGMVSFLLVAGICWSGLDVSLRGQTETTRWIYAVHVYAALLCVVSILFHTISHAVFLPEKRKASPGSGYRSLSSGMMTYAVISAVIVLCACLVLTWVYTSTTPVMSSQAQVLPYTQDYGEHPFRPSQTETASGKFIDPRQIVGSTGCGDCHAEITRQWLSSAHRQAASDKSYVTNITLLAENAGLPATRYCEGCHSPVALLTGQLTKGGAHGGVEKTVAFSEGVGCLACHNIEQVVHTKGVASYLYAPHKPYMFAGHENALAKAINHFLLRVKPEQHRSDMARTVLSDPKMCATCHAQFMDKDMNDWGWIKMQDEYTAWLESPYSKHSEQQFSSDEVTTCHDCHMPLVKARDPSGNQQGKIKSHRYLGANTVLPLLENDAVQLQMTKEFLQANKMRVTVEEPKRKDAVQSGRFINEALRTSTEAPYYFYLNEEVVLNVIVSNVGVGHDFPGGTIDINESWLAIDVKDAQGNQIYASGALDDNGYVTQNAHFYRNLPVDRNGQRVWKHDLFNQVGEVYRNVVKSGESDVVDVNFKIPAWVKSPLTISAVLKYRKFNPAYAKWALKEKYRAIPIVDVARHALVVPVHEQPSVR